MTRRLLTDDELLALPPRLVLLTDKDLRGPAAVEIERARREAHDGAVVE